ALTNRYRSGGLRFDLNTQDNSEFAKAVDSVAETRQAVGKYIRLGTTPDAWIVAGIPQAKISINDSTIRKVMGEHLNLQDHEHDYAHIHNILPETLKQLPEQLNEPIAVLQSAPTSTNPNGYIVLTELLETDKQTGKDKFVVAALNLKYDKNDNSLKVIDIPTVFGRDDWQNIRDIQNGLLKYWDKNKGQKYLNAAFALIAPPSYFKNSVLVNANVKTNEDLMQYRKDKEMQKIEERYYAQKPANAISYEEFKQEMANQSSQGIDDFVMKHYYFRDEFQDSVYQYEENGKGKFHANFVSTFEFHFEPTGKTYLVQAPFEWAKEIAKDELHRFEKRVTNAMVEISNERLNRKDLPELLGEYSTVKEETARFFGIPKEQVAEFLGYEEPKELLEQAQQIINQNNPTVLHDMNGLPEKEKNMQNIEQRYYAKFPNATHPETFTQLAKEQGKTDEEIKNALSDVFGEHFQVEQWKDEFGNGFVVDIPTNLDWESEKATFVPVIMPLEKVKSEMRFTLSDDLSGDLSRYLSDYKESGALVNLEYAIAAYEEYRQKTADFFGIEQSQVAEFLGYEEPKETLEQA
ncbi:MAG: hypothetical protein IKG79_09235, partial [Neisseriaceae bacterium]|nr:hypothetical protein [Neisseriaceae bacterium]